MPYKVARTGEKFFVAKKELGVWRRIGPYYRTKSEAEKYFRALQSHAKD